MLTPPDTIAIVMPAARSWSVYEGSCSTLLPDPELIAHFDEDAVALAISRIEAHYFVHELFLPDGVLLANVGRLAEIPCAIVQGRYDIVCPTVSADELARGVGDVRAVDPVRGHQLLRLARTRHLPHGELLLVLVHPVLAPCQPGQHDGRLAPWAVKRLRVPSKKRSPSK